MEHSMNEQLQAKLVEILAGIQSATKAAGDFAMEQLPDVVQQYVLYGRIVSLFWVFVGIALFAIGALSIKRAKLEGHGEWKYESFLKDFGLGYWVGTIFCGVGLISAATSTNAALLVWLAPKVWLLKEIAGLIK
jgi:hypothetical protein